MSAGNSMAILVILLISRLILRERPVRGADHQPTTQNVGCARFDTFIAQYNRDRPHQALDMKVPADIYQRSARVYRGIEELTDPFHDKTFTVTQCGRICFNGQNVNLSHVFAGQKVGVTQVGERVWLVTFMRYDLGYFDDETCRLEPIDTPFTPKVLPMSSE